MEEPKNIITRTIRARKEDLDRLAELGKSDFGNQPEALEALINLYDIQQSKDAIPDRKTDISDFDSHLQALSRAYLHSLDIAVNADARATDAVRAKLESKDGIIQDLQNRIAALQLQVGEAGQTSEQAAKKAEELEKALEAEHARAKTLETSLQDKARIIDALNVQIAEATRKADANAKAADRAIELQAARDAAEAESLRLKNQLEINKALADAALSKAVADAERKAQRDAADIMQTSAETMKGLYEQINRLTERAVAAEEKAAALEAKAAAPALDPAPMNDQRTAPTPKTPRKKAATKKADATPTSDAATMGDADAEKKEE